MAISLNHTNIRVRDTVASAKFLTELLGLQPHKILGHLTIVQVGDTSLGLVESDGEIARRHFGFLVSETEFEEIFERISERGLSYWADPRRTKPGQINHWDDGCGLYFLDPNGHLLEILTRPYGSGGLEAENPNPLLLES